MVVGWTFLSFFSFLFSLSFSPLSFTIVTSGIARRRKRIRGIGGAYKWVTVAFN